MNPKLLAYAIDVASFLLEKTIYYQQVKQIILFGSVARGEAAADSDVDLFIDLFQENKKTTKELEEKLNRFYHSAKYLNYWKAQGVTQEVKLTIGQLSKWDDLLPSLVANGLVLYGKFKVDVPGKHQALFIWENISPNKKRVAFNKKLLGYQHRGKKYPGLIQQQGGTRLGKGCIIVDLAAAQPVNKLFKRYKKSEEHTS